MAKEKCDNHCETCPVNGQVYCSVMFARSTNQLLSGLMSRVQSLELEIQDLRRPAEAPAVLNPLGYQTEEAEEL